MALTKQDDQELVIIVDDDEDIRRALIDLFRSIGIESLSFPSTHDLVNATLPDRPGCMVLDIRLPGISGLDLQDRLNTAGNHMPIIFLTGHGDIAMSVQAMKAGAIDFLTKPVRDQDMLDAVIGAIEKDRKRRDAEKQVAVVADLAATLTPREREVAASIAKGLMNKQIAYELGISEVTVKLHRGNVMRKMQAGSVADLVHKAALVGIGPTASPL